MTFYRCSKLESITIPESVTSIDNYAFAYCTGLTSVAIPESVTSIGRETFYGCSRLESITIPKSVKTIGAWALHNTAWYSNQDDGVIYLGKLFYGYKGYMPKGDILEIKAGTTAICGGAFCKKDGEEGYSNLASITIPEGVTSIGDYAFANCTGLTSIVIPESMASIGFYAFLNCTGLTSINIPENMTSIEHFAFEGCTGLWSEPVWESTYSTLSFFVDDTWGFKGAKRVLSVEPYYGGIEETTENNTIELTGLNAGKRYTIDLEIGSANGYICTLVTNWSEAITTKEITLQNIATHKDVNVTPTSIRIAIANDFGDAIEEIVEEGFTNETYGGQTGNTYELHGLEPTGISTTFHYRVRLNNGQTFEMDFPIEQPALEFTTLPAKATSNTVAVIAATTNLDDPEAQTGFEWRRYDAPDLVPSTMSPCPVIDGELIGALKGLNASTYYKYRPYFTSASGKDLLRRVARVRHGRRLCLFRSHGKDVRRGRHHALHGDAQGLCGGRFRRHPRARLRIPYRGRECTCYGRCGMERGNGRRHLHVRLPDRLATFHHIRLPRLCHDHQRHGVRHGGNLHHRSRHGRGTGGSRRESRGGSPSHGLL